MNRDGGMSYTEVTKRTSKLEVAARMEVRRWRCQQGGGRKLLGVGNEGLAYPMVVEGVLTGVVERLYRKFKRD